MGALRFSFEIIFQFRFVFIVLRQFFYSKLIGATPGTIEDSVRSASASIAADDAHRQGEEEDSPHEETWEAARTAGYDPFRSDSTSSASKYVDFVYKSQLFTHWLFVVKSH